jgi:hypothetical protein
VSALCFDPRHGLRAIFDNKRYDFVICYKCSSLQIIHPGHEMEYLLLEDSPDQLNAILAAAGIPLAKL